MSASKRLLASPSIARRCPIVALLVALALLGCEARGGTEGTPQTRTTTGLLPVQANLNVIVISFDALRADALGIYGNPRGATPNIDAFARDSLVFENAYSVAPVTPTSFAAAWSGFLPSRVFHGWRLRAPATLATQFAEAGYRTQAFVNNVQLAPERGFDLGFQGYDWHRSDPDRRLLEAAKAWLKAPEGQPMFVWIHFLTPHAPYREHRGASHLYREYRGGRFSKTSGIEFETSDPEEISRLRDLYLGEVWNADRMFGELVRHLMELDLLESSIVVVTSDHGEEFSDHGGFQHGRLYEEHLRIPLIVHHPGVTGRVVEERVPNVDLMPTLLNAVGHPVGVTLDGRVIPEAPAEDPVPVVALAMTGDAERWASLLAGSQKLIVSCGQESGLELYDLASDPGEQRDLAQTNPRRTRKLMDTLRAFLGGDPCPVMARATRGIGLTRGLDEESVKALRSLGYLN